MQRNQRLGLAFCATLALTFSSLVAAEPEWIANHPSHLKYYPERDGAARRGQAVQEMLLTRAPVGVQRMPQEDEMFFLEYWQFDAEGEAEIARRISSSEEGDIQKRESRGHAEEEYTNATMILQDLNAPLRLHDQSPQVDHDKSSWWQQYGRSLAVRQDKNLQCPAGYDNCAIAGQPNVCCPAGDTCIQVTDTDGVGDVGCCPAGQTCGRQVLSCRTDLGFKSCPGSQNGGCCIPNYDCEGIGCISTRTITTFTTLPTAAIISYAACPAGLSACPASLGGGCCRSGQMCWTGSTCLDRTSPTPVIVPLPTTITTTTEVAVAPVRPIPSTTYGNDETAVPPAGVITTGSTVVTLCPSHYYPCLAYYIPGCCSIGRNCGVTNCPAADASSTTIQNGVTIIVPVGETTGGTGYLLTSYSTVTTTVRSEGSAVSRAGIFNVYLGCLFGLLVGIVLL